MNTFSVTGSGRRQSRLVEIMRSFSESHGGSGFGFKPTTGTSKRVTALVASFPVADLDVIMAAAEAGVDAIEVRASGSKDLQLMLKASERLKIPYGVVLPADADERVAASAVEAGVDWVRLPITGHISTMEWDKPARVLTVPFGLDLLVAHGLNGLAVDAVLIDQAEGERPEFTYADALRLRSLSQVLKKPLLLHAGPGVPPGAAAACEYLGADALLVYLDGLRSIDTLNEYLRALEARGDHR
jgi:hypothetical protein